MDRIPTETFLQVFEHLDGPAPSEYRLHEQPSLDMFAAEPGTKERSWSLTPLKTASLVCKSWRILALPFLFRHVLWKPMVSSLSSFTLNPIPLLKFLRENKLDRNTVSFTLVIDFDDPIAIDYQVTPKIRTADLEWFWDQLFSVLDPLRFTILARPSTLAALLSRMLFLDDAWSFDIPYHILSLARVSRGTGAPSAEAGIEDPSIIDSSDQASSSSSTVVVPQDARPATWYPPRFPRRNLNFAARPREAPPCPLFTIRPWTSILLNEGSSTKVYRVYEFFLRQPPSMLGALLGCEEHPNDKPLIPSTVTDFNYVAIFPLSSHFETLLQNLPRLDRLFVQLAPRPGNNILDDADEMRHVDPADLWMERNTAYSFLIRQFLTSSIEEENTTNWARLRVFETGDAVADHEVWDLAVSFLASSSDSGFAQDEDGWKTPRKGVFVRRREQQQQEQQLHAWPTTGHHLLSNDISGSVDTSAAAWAQNLDPSLNHLL